MQSVSQSLKNVDLIFGTKPGQILVDQAQIPEVAVRKKRSFRLAPLTRTADVPVSASKSRSAR
jgi:hypothetical protein